MENSGRPEKSPEKTDRTLFLGIEAGPGRPKDKPWRGVTLSAVIAGCMPVFILFLTVGPVLVTSLQEAGLSEEEIIGWMFGIHVFGGLNGLILALYYKQPLLGAYSIPGIAIVAGALATVTYPQAIGGFIVAGFIVLALGLSGAAKKVIRFIPGPIMAAMIGGILLSFPLQIIDGLQADLALGVAAVLGYVAFHLWVPRIPGIVGALITGGVAAVVLNRFEFAPVALELATPHFQAPEFTLVAVVSVSVPLAIAVMGSENMQAIGVMRTIGFRPPVTAMTVVSGIGGMLAGIFGGHNANIAGPGTAAVASPEAGPAKSRYIVAIIASFVVIAFGVFAPMATQVFALFPETLLAVLVGLVLLPIVASAFNDAWNSGRFRLSVAVTFIVAISGISPFGISSAFWALLFGCLIALIAENKDYRECLKESDEDDGAAAADEAVAGEKDEAGEDRAESPRASTAGEST